MTFPATPLSTVVEILLQGDTTWTDITSFVRNEDQIRISRGRADEASQADYQKCQLTLEDIDGRFNTRNPNGAYFGKLVRNTPLRVAVTGYDTPYLYGNGNVGDYVSTPDAAALDITGDLDIRFEGAMDQWDNDSFAALVAKWDVTGNQMSYLLYVENGKLWLSWTTGGSTATLKTASSSVRIPVASDNHIAVRATLDVNNGAGGTDVIFYWSTSIGGTWTQIGGTQTLSGTTSVFAGTAELRILQATSSVSPRLDTSTGSVQAMQLRNLIGGTVVANPDFTIQTPGATSFVDSTTKTWTLHGNTVITDRIYRFSGKVPSWAPRWENKYDIVTPIEAAGPMRQLAQNSSNIEAALTKKINKVGILPKGYWTLEDSATATYQQKASSFLANGSSASIGGLEFAADDSLGGSKPLVRVRGDVTHNSYFTGTANTYANVGFFEINFVYKLVTAAAVSGARFIQWTGTGTVKLYTLYIASTTTAQIVGVDDAGITVISDTFAMDWAAVEGLWNRFRFVASSTGGTATYTATFYKEDDTTSAVKTVTWAGAVGVSSTVQFIDLAGIFDDVILGHFSIWNTDTGDVYSRAWTGYLGESSQRRFIRLCNEELMPNTASSFDAQPMGAQTPMSLLSLLQDCANADIGILYESRHRVGMQFKSHQALMNQPVRLSLAYSGTGEVQTPLDPTEDDQLTKNDVTVTRTGGTSFRATDDTSTMGTAAIGVYASSQTVNVSTDAMVDDVAGWILQLGTWDEARYPQITCNLAHMVSAGKTSLMVSAAKIDVGDRVQITGPPAWLPPETIDQLVQGYSEVLDSMSWSITYNCSPAGPWTVGTYAAAVSSGAGQAKYNSDGTTVGTLMNTTVTTMSLVTPSGPLWTTDAAQMPIPVMVGGEKMAITAISGTSSPQSATVTRSVNGVVKSQAVGTVVKIYPTATYAF